MLRCPECPVGQRGEAVRTGGAEPERHLISLTVAKKAIDRFEAYAHTVIFHFQGEPLLHPELPEMIRYAHDKRLFTMLSTNAQLLTPELAAALAEAGLDRIIVSVDGLTQDVYAHYRVGGSLERALFGMRAMADLPRRPEIVLQCLRLKSNEHQWDAFRKQYKALGADRLEMKTAQLYDYEHGHPDMPTRTRDARYKKGADGLYHPKKHLVNRCYRLWSGTVVTTDGVLLPCCYDKGHAYPIGTVDSGFLPAADAFKRRILHNRKGVDICCNCDE